MRSTFLRAAVLAAAVTFVGGAVAAPAHREDEPVQIVFAAATEFPEFSRSFENAIRLALERHGTIRGRAVELALVETSCGGDNRAAAKSIVADARNAAVIGHVCSAGFTSALPVYEAAGLVTVSGSATAEGLPRLGPTVFNRTIVRDGDGVEEWMARVLALPSVRSWSTDYEARFGAAPPDLAVFYYDAASLVLRRLQQSTKIEHGVLVVDRAQLARAVRQTEKYRGVTCTVALDPATGNRVNDAEALARCEG